MFKRSKNIKPFLVYSCLILTICHSESKTKNLRFLEALLHSSFAVAQDDKTKHKTN